MEQNLSREQRMLLVKKQTYDVVTYGLFALKRKKGKWVHITSIV